MAGRTRIRARMTRAMGLACVAAWACGWSGFCAEQPTRGSAKQAAQLETGPLLIGAEWPCDASDSVKQLFYETGMNFARITGGGYSWAIDSHTTAAAELEAHGVKVVLQLGSHYPSADYFKFTDSWFVDHKGQTGVEDRNVWAITYSGQAWPQYSYASDEYRPLMETDFSRYLAVFKERANVAGIILHNEPGLFWLKDRLFDYNPTMIAKYRTWLQQRYGQIGTLNAAYGSQFASFDAVEPPRQLPPVDNLAAWLDWRRAQAAIIHDFLQWEIASTRRAWPGMPLTTNLAGPLESWFPIRCADNFLFTEGMDAAGIDIYPEKWHTRHFTGCTMDLTRGAAQERPVWVLEAQSYDEQAWAELTPPQLAGMLRSEVWSFIGHGARAISLWAWSGRSGWNLTRGEFNPRVAAMREIAHTSAMLRLGNFQKPKRQVAVVVDPDSFFYYGGQKADPPWFLDKAGPGMHAALADAGYESDVLFTEQVRRGDACKYRAMALTVPVMVDDVLARRLDEFVRGGGLLIAEAPFAEADGTGRALAAKPGCGLDKLFGVHVLQTTTENVRPLKVGTSLLTATLCRSEIELAGAQIIGTLQDDATPAVTRNYVGAGAAIFIGATVSFPYCDGWRTWASPGLSTFLRSQIEPRIGPPPFEIKYGGKELLDHGLLADAKDNQVLTLSVPPHMGKPPAAITDVEISCEASQVKGMVRACLLAPSVVADGKVRSVPRPLAVETADGQTVKIKVGTVDSAAVVVFARDMPPVLGIEAPATSVKGAEFSVTVTCLKLSPKETPGTIDLVLPPTCRNITGPQPSGQETYAFRVQASAEPQRAVIKACFIPAGTTSAAARIVSVPVDVAIQ